MLQNYNRDEFGVIHQIKSNKFNYDSNYIEHSYCSPEMQRATENMANLRLGYIIGTLGDYQAKSILDVGYGNGAFLNVAKRYFDRCSGYDVIDNRYLPVGVTREDNITDNYYDVVTFFDSLEHCESLDFIKQIECEFLVVSLPWCHYLSDSWFEQWKHRKPDEHLHHFNSISLTNFMEDKGFEYINCCNVEDVIRTPVDNLPNILTATFRKR